MGFLKRILPRRRNDEELPVRVGWQEDEAITIHNIIVGSTDESLKARYKLACSCALGIVFLHDDPWGVPVSDEVRQQLEQTFPKTNFVSRGLLLEIDGVWHMRFMEHLATRVPKDVLQSFVLFDWKEEAAKRGISSTQIEELQTLFRTHVYRGTIGTPGTDEFRLLLDARALVLNPMLISILGLELLERPLHPDLVKRVRDEHPDIDPASLYFVQPERTPMAAMNIAQIVGLTHLFHHLPGDKASSQQHSR
jgi:hypothetical protein